MQPHVAMGALPYDLAHMLGAGVLVLSFVLLYQQRLVALVHTYAAQAITLAAAAAWQGWAQHEPGLFLTAAIAFAAKGVIIPIALHRVIRQLRITRGVDAALGVFASMALGLGLVVLAILVVLPTTASAQILAREDLGLALSVVLLGLLMMITRRNAISQVIGFMSLENGLILAAVGVAGMPMVVELSVAVLVLVAFFVFGVFFFRLRDRFDSLDVQHLDRVGGSHQ